MKYDLMKVLRALEACYVCDINPVSVDMFIMYFCNRYELDVETETSRIRGMLQVLAKQKKIKLADGVIYLENMLRSNLKLEIKG